MRDAADNGAGVVLVEQHVRQALRIADEVHILQRGRIVLSGPAAEIQGRIGEIERSYLSGV